MRVAPGPGTEKMERKTSMTGCLRWWPSTTLTWPSCTRVVAEPVSANAVRRWSGPKRPFPCRWTENHVSWDPAPFEYQWTRDAPKWPKCWRATKTPHMLSEMMRSRIGRPKRSKIASKSTNLKNREEADYRRRNRRQKTKWLIHHLRIWRKKRKKDENDSLHL